MQFDDWLLSLHPTIAAHQAVAVLTLSAEEATVPFMARYRKEQTGNLDEVEIQNILDAKEKWDDICKKQQHMSGEISKNGKIPDEKKKEILEKIAVTFDLSALEDIYLPYKVKRKTKAQKAREAGLQPLADWIWNCGHGTQIPQPGQTLELWAFTFRNDEQGVKTAEDAVNGAQDIIIERLSEIPHLRDLVRQTMSKEGVVATKKAEKAREHSRFEKYFNAQEKIESLMKPENSHRYLAMRRGWLEEELKLNLVPGDSEEKLQSSFESEACTDLSSACAPVLIKAARLAMKAHVLASIENEMHTALKTVADGAAIKVFAENVRKLLLSSPYGAKAVLGVDPGVRTGCKLAVVDDSGKFLASSVMHIEDKTAREQARKMIKAVLENADIKAVAVGNGTAGREAEGFIRETLKSFDSEIPVVMVSEAGASVYSASEAARVEFPDLDITVRGAISIARRLQDPLAELVKTDPKSIGVGQYQHDVNQNQLKKSLESVVDSCVNNVGVNLNTASYHLLSHVSGIGPGLAKSIVEYREKNSLFKSRTELMDVPRFTKKAFEQAAGFLRIPTADHQLHHPLDNTGVHPERYDVLEAFALTIGKSVRDLIGNGVELVRKAKDLKDKIGEFTFADIVRELEKPGRDPRSAFEVFSFREDIHHLPDLKPGMICPGIVTNVTNFGAFVDIGVHQDGLVHISQLANTFVKDPSLVVSPGDKVKVKIVEVNLEKKQIALSMRLTEYRPENRPENKTVKPDNGHAPPQRSEQNTRTGDPRSNQRPPLKHRAPGPLQKQPQKQPERKLFNNAFAGLAGLKINK